MSRKTEVICNMCGKQLDGWDIAENFSMYRLLGYGTEYDGEELQLDLCCDCVEELIKRCRVNPVTSRKDCDECEG